MKKMPHCVRTRSELRAVLASHKAEGRKIGFVPTMGALHDGHISLVEKCVRNSDVTVASIFVNPTQFAPGEDLDSYPRTEETDIEKLAAAGCDVVYLPTEAEMYPEGSVTNIRVEGLSDLLEGIYRPHFFYGVTTIVARLFIHVEPDVAVFGEKDFQQLQIIRRMTRDLGFSIDILGAETVRDADGLAQSSRNAYLSKDERNRASTMSASLHRAKCRIAAGANVETAVLEASQAILGAGFETLDYVRAVDPESLVDNPEGPLEPGRSIRLLAAAWLGRTRLIDNLGCARD